MNYTSETLKGYETITISGHAEPAWLVDARDAMEQGWQLYSDACDIQDKALIESRGLSAANLERYYDALCKLYNEAKEMLLRHTRCECGPSYQCNRCIANAILKYGDRRSEYGENT